MKTLKTHLPHFTIVVASCVLFASVGLAAPTVVELSSNPETLEIQGQAAGQELGGTGLGISRTLTTGDLNGDGIGDLVIATPNYGTTGAVHVVFGRATWPTNLALIPDLAEVVIGGASSQRLATALAIGDVNGDGLGDLVVGANTLDAPGLTDCGKVLIYFGRTNWPAALNIADADVILTGDTASGYFGESLCLGDFDGDGIADLAVTAPRHDVTTTIFGVETNLTLFGKVYVFRGNTNWPAAPALGTAATVLHGVQTSSLLNAQVWAGDCNGDGRADLFLGAFGARPIGVTPSPSSKKIGIVWGLLGRPAHAWPATVNLLNFESATVGEHVDFYVHGNNAAYGIGIRGACGDLNGDGFSDLIVAASPSFSHLYVFFGRTNFAPLEPFAPADIDLRRDRYFGSATVLGHPGVTSLSHVLNTMAVGDFDGDGLDDLLTGFSTANVSGRNQAGLVALRYGRSEWPVIAENDDVLYHGEAASDGAGAMVAVGDITGDGRAELIFNAPGADRIGVSSMGKVYIITGEYSPPTLDLVVGSGVATVAAGSRSGRTLRLEASEDLGTWTPMSTWNSDGSTVSTNEAAAAPHRFYRLRVNPAP